MRNEILEAGQQILLHISSDWIGNTKIMATLIDKISINSNHSEYWRVFIQEGITTTWWFGKVGSFDKINTEA